MKSEIVHQDHYTFTTKVRSHSFNMDVSTVGGGKDTGPSPKELLLSSIIGCTGMDVVGLLRKKQLTFNRLSISGTAEQTKEHPKVFTEVLIDFRFEGHDLEVEPLQEAVDLSLTKYCGVSAMVAKVVPIRYVININDMEVAQGTARFWNS